MSMEERLQVSAYRWGEIKVAFLAWAKDKKALSRPEFKGSEVCATYDGNCINYNGHPLAYVVNDAGGSDVICYAQETVWSNLIADALQSASIQAVPLSWMTFSMLAGRLAKNGVTLDPVLLEIGIHYNRIAATRR